MGMGLYQLAQDRLGRRPMGGGGMGGGGMMTIGGGDAGLETGAAPGLRTTLGGIQDFGGPTGQPTAASQLGVQRPVFGGGYGGRMMPGRAGAPMVGGAPLAGRMNTPAGAGGYDPRRARLQRILAMRMGGMAGGMRPPVQGGPGSAGSFQRPVQYQTPMKSAAVGTPTRPGMLGAF